MRPFGLRKGSALLEDVFVLDLMTNLLILYVMKPETIETIKKVWSVIKQIIEVIIIAIAGGSLMQ